MAMMQALCLAWRAAAAIGSADGRLERSGGCCECFLGYDGFYVGAHSLWAAMTSVDGHGNAMR